MHTITYPPYFPLPFTIWGVEPRYWDLELVWRGPARAFRLDSEPAWRAYITGVYETIGYQLPEYNLHHWLKPNQMKFQSGKRAASLSPVYTFARFNS